MMKKKFIAETDSELRDWEIYEEGHLVDIFGTENNKHLKYPKDGIFAIEEVDKDGKIKGIFDAGFLDYYIEKAEKKKRFQEEAIFTVIIDFKKVDEFEGTFIDALKYIKRYWDEQSKKNTEG